MLRRSATYRRRPVVCVVLLIGCVVLISCGYLLLTPAAARHTLTLAAVSGAQGLFDRVVATAQLHNPGVIAADAPISRSAIRRYLPGYQSRVGRHTLLAAHGLTEIQRELVNRDSDIASSQKAQNAMLSMDHNHNGFVDGFEFEFSGRTHGDFVRCDQNSDGVLDVQELEHQAEVQRALEKITRDTFLDIQITTVGSAFKLPLSVITSPNWSCEAVVATFPTEMDRAVLLLGRVDWHAQGCLSGAPMKSFQLVVTPELELRPGVFLVLPKEWSAEIMHKQIAEPTVLERLLWKAPECAGDEACGPGIVCGCGLCTDGAKVE